MDDPLNINIPLEGIDTSFPLMPEGDYPLQIVGNKLGPNYDKTVQCWEPELVTTTQVTSVDGRDIPVNSKAFLQWPIDLAAKPDAKDPTLWRTTLCNTVDAIMGSTKENRPAFTKALLDSMIGKTIIGHVIIDEDKNGVRRNKVKRLKKAA